MRKILRNFIKRERENDSNISRELKRKAERSGEKSRVGPGQRLEKQRLFWYIDGHPLQCTVGIKIFTCKTLEWIHLCSFGKILAEACVFIRYYL